MAIPKIVLVARKSLENGEEALKEQLAIFHIKMAIAVTPEDAEQAKKLTEAVAQFQHVTAIVADFPLDMIIDEDGVVTPLGVVVPKVEEPQLITEV